MYCNSIILYFPYVPLKALVGLGKAIYSILYIWLDQTFVIYLNLDVVHLAQGVICYVAIYIITVYMMLEHLKQLRPVSFSQSFDL